MRFFIFTRYFILNVVLVTLGAACLLSRVSPLASAVQVTPKLIREREKRNTNPIQIVEVSANSKTIKLNEEFASDKNWLKDLRIRLKNSAKKNIRYVEVWLNFPETVTSGSEMSYRSELGNSPSKPDGGAPLLLAPGEEVTVQLNDEAYQGLIRFLDNRVELNELRMVELEIRFVVFEDLAGWQTGIYFRQDPNKPSRWLPLPKEPQE
jgi:hypothetical protein